MSWSRIRQASLKLRLLALLLPTLGLVTVGSLWSTRADALASANAAYDRSLLGAIKALDLNVSTASGGLAVELPYRLFEFFQLTASGSVYFSVATADGLVQIGSADLPKPPSPLDLDRSVFYDATYFGQAVRVAAFMRALDPQVGGDQRLVIQVAESTSSRERFTDSFMRRAAMRDALLLLVTGVVAFVGLTLALRPMTRLARQTRARAVDDLRPLRVDDLPSDVVPLVGAINQQLARTEKLMAERRGFIDDASHQLRTPLTVLRAHVDYLLRETDVVRQQAALPALSVELDHAIRATNQLLTLARSDAAVAQQDNFDLGELVREVAVDLLPLARARHIDLGVDIGDMVPQASGDRGLLKQALLNVAHNAIEHGRSSGVVTLEADGNAKGWTVRITDDGPGIDVDVAARLGERFAKGRGSLGSGLGLAIARSVVERHGGHLGCEPVVPGPGTRVWLGWPAR